jgi:two-component system nitrogen regulation sensor histidine kinase NtrY
MGFSRFSAMLALRLLFIMVALAIVGILILTPGYHAATLLSMIVAAGLTFEVLKFISKTNQELVRFLDAARYGDYGQRFEFKMLGSGFSELGDTFTQILSRFRDDRVEQESELRHLKALLEHVPVPLISVYGDRTVTLWNNAARRLFGTFHPNRVDDLEQFGHEFQDRISRIKAGDRFLVTFHVDGMEQRLTVSASEILVAGKTERLVSLQNIQSELDGVQLSAWQDLVRVLTHEIMNSITPVASLAKTAVDLVDDVSQKVTNQDDLLEELQDAKDAVNTVARRSDSLMTFVSSYRQLTRLPEPSKERVQLRELFDDVCKLSAANWAEKGWSMMINVEPIELDVFADRQMMEQVLINLLRNAENAFEGDGQSDQGRVLLSGSLNRRGHVVIEVADNGPGIDEDVVDRIFVPFYTTRREGSGVGLALSRQVMIAHGGTILFSNVITAEETRGGARFTLVF